MRTRLQDFIGMLRDFEVSKALRKLYNKQTNVPRNAIVEFADGEHAIVRLTLEEAIPYPKCMEITRITFFVKERDYRKPREVGRCRYLEAEVEFVRCSDD